LQTDKNSFIVHNHYYIFTGEILQQLKHNYVESKQINFFKTTQNPIK